MIKINENDTIVDVVNKINKCEDKELILEFPFSHPILHNYMSLKILKSKSGVKRITIVTSDILSKKIGNSIGINYSIIKDSNYINQKLDKQQLLKHNFSFFEFFIYQIKNYYARFLNFIGKKTGINSLKYYNPYDKVKNSGAFLLFFGLTTSIGMLMFIFYFAVNRTYIDITPEINIKTNGINIIYEENLKEDYNSISQELRVNLKKISSKIELESNYKSSGIDYEKTSRAIAEVTFFNELREDQTFRPKTRLVNEDGIIFETQDWVKIPKSYIDEDGKNQPGKLVIEVIAQFFDQEGQFIGERGNIEKGTFLLPGLKFSQDRIYARLNKPAKGGTNDVSYLISKEDIENANKNFENKLKQEAINKIKEIIANENKSNTIKTEIIGINDVINYKDLNIENIGNFKIGDKIEDFGLKGSIEIETYTYNKTSVINILRAIVNEKLLPGTDKLIFINEESLRTPLVLEKISENPLIIKATTEIDSGISFDFDNISNYTNQRLKTQILGLNNKEAINILLNNPNISNVRIKN
ncbi:MAG: hypothetical protein NWP80_01080, partial [Candidatus Gracilibacteria bacterium]|nr:hypothetical protein [Candidatus Gracilibacteria bacterium]